MSSCGNRCIMIYKTKILKVEESRGLNEADCAPLVLIDEAANLLKKGSMVAFPTETVYGLGANGLDAKAAAGIFTAKGRPKKNPLSLLVADREMIDMVAAEIPEVAERLIKAFFPGPLTIILKKKDIVPSIVAGGLSTVGVRMPNNPIAIQLIQRAGFPLAAPSANLSGRPSPTSAQAVHADLNGRIPLILDGGLCRLGVESTLVDCTGDTPLILRPGTITKEQLSEAAGCPVLQTGDEDKKSPSEQFLHYAPKAPMTVLEGPAERMAEAMTEQVEKLKKEGKLVGVLASPNVVKHLVEHGVLLSVSCISCGDQGDLAAVGANLYDALRKFDNKMVNVILAEGVPDEGLGIAIMNRLRKASEGRIIRI